jgi:hypothetical protein
MTTVARSPHLDCLPAAPNGPQAAHPSCPVRAVGARKGDAEGVHSALRPARSSLRLLGSSQKGIAA